MAMSASSRLYYQWRYEKDSRWISPDMGIFEIRDFEDPLAGPYLECIKDKITNDIGFALYDLWMAKDCVMITKWWKLHLKKEFWEDYRYIKAHLKHLYKDLEKINKAILIKNNERYAQYQPLGLNRLHYLIDLSRIDPTQHIDLTQLVNARGVTIQPLKRDYGGSDICFAKVNIEVQWSSQLAIAAIEKNGGDFYDPRSLDQIFGCKG